MTEAPTNHGLLTMMILGRFHNEHEAFETYKLKLAEIGEVLA